MVGIGPWTPPALSFPLPVTRDWFPDDELETLTIALPDGPPLVVQRFLRWLRQGDGRLGPCLVVAPKTLLGNWRDEIVAHLVPGALGRQLDAFGASLRTLRLAGAGGNDTQLARQTLDDTAIGRADLVLTTYETSRDYQLSFAKIPFAVVVFDEAQRLKNPATLFTQAAKAQQGRFNLGGARPVAGAGALCRSLPRSGPGRSDQRPVFARSQQPGAGARRRVIRRRPDRWAGHRALSAGPGAHGRLNRHERNRPAGPEQDT